MTSLELQLKNSKAEVDSLVKEYKLLEKENDKLKSRIDHYVSIRICIIEGILSLSCSYIQWNLYIKTICGTELSGLNIQVVFIYRLHAK